MKAAFAAAAATLLLLATPAAAGGNSVMNQYIEQVPAGGGADAGGQVRAGSALDADDRPDPPALERSGTGPDRMLTGLLGSDRGGIGPALPAVLLLSLAAAAVLSRRRSRGSGPGRDV